MVDVVLTVLKDKLNEYFKQTRSIFWHCKRWYPNANQSRNKDWAFNSFCIQVQ